MPADKVSSRRPNESTRQCFNRRQKCAADIRTRIRIWKIRNLQFIYKLKRAEGKPVETDSKTDRGYR